MVREKHECDLIKKEERVQIQKIESWGWCLLIMIDFVLDRWSIARNIVGCPYCLVKLTKNEFRNIEVTDTHGKIKIVKSDISDDFLCADKDCNRYLKGKNKKYCSIKCKNKNIRKR